MVGVQARAFWQVGKPGGETKCRIKPRPKDRLRSEVPVPTHAPAQRCHLVNARLVRRNGAIEVESDHGAGTARGGDEVVSGAIKDRLKGNEPDVKMPPLLTRPGRRLNAPVGDFR